MLETSRQQCVQASVLRAACLSLKSAQRESDGLCSEENTAAPCIPGSAAAFECESGENARAHRTSCVAGGPIANGAVACKCSPGYVNPEGASGALDADEHCVSMSDPCLRDGSCVGSSSDVAAIAGGSAAAAVVVLAVLALALCLCLRRRRKSGGGARSSPEAKAAHAPASWQDGMDGDEMQRHASQNGKEASAAIAASVYVAGATGGEEEHGGARDHVLEPA